MSDRPRRNVVLVDYTEPGDYPDRSAEELSVEVPDSVFPDSERAVGEPLLTSSPRSSAVEVVSSPEISIVEEGVNTMASARGNQLIAELEAIFFQLEEVEDDVGERLGVMSTNELNNCLSELKELRVSLVKANQELNLVTNDRGYDNKS